MSFTYRGLKAENTRHIVTNDEIDRQLIRLQQSNPRIAAVKDRPTQLGDEVVLDYAGFCDGQQFAGGTAQNQTLVLGSGMFIPGFEEQLVDKVPEETVVVKVTFPESYHAEDLAGKEAEFRCVIHEIRMKSAYELDDVFAREVGGCENLEQLRQRLKETLQSYADERGEMDLQDRLLRQAAATLEFTPSQAQLEAELDNQMQNLTAQLAQQGLTLDMYCQFMNTTQETLRQEAKQTALQSILAQAAVEQIVALENLEATEEEVGQALAVICRQNQMTLEELKPYYDDAFRQAVVRSVLMSKAMKLIRDEAEITEVAENG